MFCRTFIKLSNCNIQSIAIDLAMAHKAVSIMCLAIGSQDFLTRLKNAGVDTLPGTSAEILDDNVREKLAKGRLSTKEWIEVSSWKASRIRAPVKHLYQLIRHITVSFIRS